MVLYMNIFLIHISLRKGLFMNYKYRLLYIIFRLTTMLDRDERYNI